MKHPAVLCFHHRDPGSKSFTISGDRRRTKSIRKLQEEIEKCDVLCVNCHTKRHWREKYALDSWEEILDVEGNNGVQDQRQFDS